MPKVCVPLLSASEEALYKEARDAVETAPDLIEWRADFYEDLDDPGKTTETLQKLSDIIGRIPLIFTIRTDKEGGNREISTEDYLCFNLNAADSGKADFIDVEVFGDSGKKAELIRGIHEKGARVIASYHDFKKTEDREALLARFKEMDATGADILKIAMMPKEFDDTAAVMQVCAEMSRSFTEKPLIAISMGQAGSMSRIAGENFGSSVTFACVGEASAPGQFEIRDLRLMLKALHDKNRA